MKRANLKVLASLALASALVIAGHAQTATTKKAPTAKKSAKPSVKSQIESLQEQMSSQNSQIQAQNAKIQALQQQLADRDTELQQAQQAAAQAQAAAAQAQQSAQAQQTALTDNSQAVTSLQSSVADLRANAVSIVTTVQDQQAQVTKQFSGLSDLAHGKVKIGATFYGDWAYYTDTGFGPQFLTQLNQDGPGNSGFNAFDITRAYINLFYTPTEAVTLRITPNIYRQVDVSGATSNGKGSATSSSSNGNLGYRLKYAYAQFNGLFRGSEALKKDNLRFGQQMNPLVDWEEQLWGYRYVNLTPWNYLSLSSTYTGATMNGSVLFHGKEYLDYQIGAFNTASFHAIETNDKKQGMVRVTWYPFGTTVDRTGFGITGFEDYGYNTKTPDTKSTPINRLAVLAHYETHSQSYLIAGEYDLGRNAFSTGNLFSGSGPADEFGLGPTQYATFDALAKAILGGDKTRQQGFAFFGHARLGNSPFSAFGFYHYFQPNTKISGTNPIDFARTVGGISYKFNDHFEFAIDDQNLNYFHNQFTMSRAQIATFSSSLAAANPNGIPNVVPDGTNAVFANVLFNY